MAFESPERQGPNSCVILSKLLHLSEPELLYPCPPQGYWEEQIRVLSKVFSTVPES